MENTTRMSSKGQVVIPKGVRSALGLRDGDEFEVGIEGNRLVLRPVSSRHRDWKSLEGAFATGRSTADVLAEGRAEEIRKERS